MEKKLYIKGNCENGDEVIEILEDLGGDNLYNKHNGKDEESLYYIDYNDCNLIKKINKCDIKKSDFITYFILSVDEFYERFPFKMYDNVKLKFAVGDFEVIGLKWLNNISNHQDYVLYTVKLIDSEYETTAFARDMKSVYTEKIENNHTLITKVNDDEYILDVNSEWEIIDDSEKIVLKRKGPKYPKTFKECCDLLGIKSNFYFKLASHSQDDEYNDFDNISILYNYKNYSEIFCKLIICRDAFWKIDNWEPDWMDSEGNKYTIEVCNNDFVTDIWRDYQKLFCFKTEKARDLFMKYFNELLEEFKKFI